MENFLFNFLYYGLLIMSTIAVTALLTVSVVLLIKTIKRFIEDIFY